MNKNPFMSVKPCKGCGEEIGWIWMLTGAKMPVNPKPIKVIAYVNSGNGQMISAYIPHWGECPAADQFKKKKEDRK